MRVLASTGPLFSRPLDWALGVLAEAGFDGAELMVTPDPATRDAARVTSIARREGIAVPAVHGPFLLVTRRVLGTEPVTKARRSLQLAARLGADVLVVHPPLRWQRGFHQWLVADAAAEASALGIRLGVENLYPVSVGGRQVRFHRCTDPRHLAPFGDVVLDTSHLGVAGHDLCAAYDRLSARIAHLHVSDHPGGPRDRHAPLGHGQLPLAAFLNRIGDDERRGRGRVGTGRVALTLELECRPHLDDRAGLVAFLAGELAKCRALLAGAPGEEILGRPDPQPAHEPGGPPAEPAPHARD